MYMDATLVQLEATQENQEASQQDDLYKQQALGQQVVQETASDLSLDHRGYDDHGAVVAADGGVEREHMFDKVVTPSDVGKLNRLVVPKQHAERYFPAAAATAAAGTQLCFQDRAGTPWRFRYSYWGSSQSYVMTKGWSRFVRAARLAAGDTVSFSRAATGGRYFIDYRHCQRRRRDIVFGTAAAVPALPLFGHAQTADTGGSATTILDTARVVAGHHVKAGPTAARSFRLFGVDVECGAGDEVTAVEEDNVDEPLVEAGNSS